MGLPFPFLCHFEKQSQSQSQYQSESESHSESSSASLTSQPSLPSVPSLTSQLISQFPSAAAAHHHCLATLKANSSSVSSLHLAGKHLYTATSDGNITIWPRHRNLNYQNPTNEFKVAGGGAAIKSMVVVGDNLFTAHQDYRIRVWKMKIDHSIPNQKYFKPIATLPTFNDRFSKLFLAKNYVKVRRHKKCTWVHHVDAVAALAVSNDGEFLYSASWDRSFKVWRTSDFRCMESVRNAHDDAINAAVLSGDGFFYTGSADRKIKVWKKKQMQKHELVATLEKHRSAVNALALSSDGSVLYSGACDRSILVWERPGAAACVGREHMVVVGALRGHTKAILCLAVVGDLVCSGSGDKTIRVWRREVAEKKSSYSCLAVLGGHGRPVKCLTAAAESKNGGSSEIGGSSYLVYSGSLDYDVKVWQLWVPFS